MKKSQNLWTYALAVIPVTVGLTGCDNIGNTNNGNDAPQTISAANSGSVKNVERSMLRDNYFILRMGSGFDSSSKAPTSGQSCLKASSNQNNIFITNPEALITLDQQTDFATLENNLGVDVTSNVGGGRFATSITADFVNATKNNKYQTNILYLYKYAGTASFKNGSLNQGHTALTEVTESLSQTNPIHFREMCGDGYVEQMDAGATLAIRLTLSFNSHADQEKLKDQISAQVGLANIAAEIKKVADNKNIHVGFSLSAIQLGGEPQKLNDIFGSQSSTGNYPFVECGDVQSQNPDACNLMTSAIIDYAQSMKAQITEPGGKIKLDNLYYTNPVVSNYNTLGVITGAQTLAQKHSKLCMI